MPANRPNIIYINTHDSGAHFACYGAPCVQTPNIDRLAAEGVRFTRMFSTCSICSPSRASLLTGMYPQNNGMEGLAGGRFLFELNDPRQHLSHFLRDAGYETVFCGIQHETRFMETLGFDRNLNNERQKHGGVTEEDFKSALDHAGVAAAFLKERGREKPFYLQLGFFESHTPYEWGGNEPADENGVWFPPYMNKTEQDDDGTLRRHIAMLQASIQRVDQAVGLVLAAVRDAGLEENTIVLFTTDHGVELPRAKWTVYDAGCHVAFIVRWPGGGLEGGRTCDLLLSNVDFFPTLCYWIGESVPERVDGVSFAAAMKQDAPQPVRDSVFLYHAYPQSYALRTGRYKLIRNFTQAGYNVVDLKQMAALPKLELYDIENDPNERTNLADAPALKTVREQLDGQLWDLLDDLLPTGLERPFLSPALRQLIAEHAAWKVSGVKADPAELEACEKRVDGVTCAIAHDGFELVRHFAPATGQKSTIRYITSLHDIRRDVGQQVNLVDDPAHEAVRAKLDALFWTWIEAEHPDLLALPEPTPAHDESMADRAAWRERAASRR